MARNFPLFMDISQKKIIIYGAGRIASRRVEILLAFAPLLTVIAPRASSAVLKAHGEGRLCFRSEGYKKGTIPADTWMVLAATDDASVNEEIYLECKEKGILVNVCSNRKLCDFQFPGIAYKDSLVIGVNAGGNDHHLAKKWTDKIRKEVEKDGYDSQAEKTPNNGKS